MNNFHWTWKWLADWCSDVGKAHHGYIVIDSCEGKRWDWGQALCRELYGFDWMNNEAFDEINDMPPEEPAPDYVMDAAKAMMTDLPDWIDAVV